ncbi:thiol-disulfide oxidoreductase DCC family protein [Streptomyces sp. NPDC000405]|uniref:thiol-disulfide oxidoreductase DCC family protein n=1 Tax=Streptomyces sp. NPDC000405 TaxID=3161033 RepID=UPI00398CF116
MRDTGPTSACSTPVLAFDGDCGFCQTAIDQVRASARPAMRAVPWQSLPQETIRRHQGRLDREVLLLLDGQVLVGGAEALAVFVGQSPARRYRLAGRAVRLPVIRAGARIIYRWVARNRHRMPSGTAACVVPKGHT